MAFPTLTPLYGLGSYSRTSSGTFISCLQTNLGSQGRIYAWMKSHGQGPQYIDYLINVLGKR